MLPSMAGLSEHTREQIALHRQVAHMYRRRSAYPFAEAFQDERNAILMSLAPARPAPGPAGTAATDVPAAATVRALDLGCGTGITIDLLVERYGEAVGVDVSQEMLDGYQRGPDSPVELVRADMAALPFLEGRFDVVVCRSALHHMDDEVGVLSEICRVLAPDGSLILGEPANDNVLTRAARWWVRRRPSFGKLHTIDRAYTRRQLRELLEQAGLEVRREQRFGFIAYPLCDNPDLVPVLKLLPFAGGIAAALRAVDRLLARIPVVKNQSWYTMLEVGRRTGRP